MKSFQMRTCCYSDICPVSLGGFVNISSDVNVKTFVVDLNEMTDCIRILISDTAKTIYTLFYYSSKVVEIIRSVTLYFKFNEKSSVPLNTCSFMANNCGFLLQIIRIQKVYCFRSIRFSLRGFLYSIKMPLYV